MKNSSKPASNKPRNIRNPKFRIKWIKVQGPCPWCEQRRKKPSDTDLINFICDMVDKRGKVVVILPHGVRFLGNVRESKDARAAIVALMRRTK